MDHGKSETALDYKTSSSSSRNYEGLWTCCCCGHNIKRVCRATEMLSTTDQLDIEYGKRLILIIDGLDECRTSNCYEWNNSWKTVKLWSLLTTLPIRQWFSRRWTIQECIIRRDASLSWGADLAERDGLLFEEVQSPQLERRQSMSTDKVDRQGNSVNIAQHLRNENERLPPSYANYPRYTQRLLLSDDNTTRIAAELFSLVSMACSFFINDRGRALTQVGMYSQQSIGAELSDSAPKMDWILLMFAILYSLSTTSLHYLHSLKRHERQNLFLCTGICMGMLHNTVLHGRDFISLLLCFMPGWVLGSLVLSSWWHRSLASGLEVYVCKHDSKAAARSESQEGFKDEKTDTYT